MWHCARLNSLAKGQIEHGGAVTTAIYEYTPYWLTALAAVDHGAFGSFGFVLTSQPVLIIGHIV